MPNVSNLPNGMFGVWVRFISAALVIPLGGFMFIKIMANEREIAVMQGNRYTSADALEDAREHAEQIASLWAEMAELRVAIASLPPQEFRDKVDGLLERIHRVELETKN